MSDNEVSREWVTTSDGVNLAVNLAGPEDAPLLVAVHGYPDNSSMWDDVVDELADRYRVVTYDVRGAGDSDKPKPRKAYRLDQLADDLADVIDSVRPQGKVHLLAHDWGSIQTWHAVTGERLRGRIASYTSISGPCLDHAGQWFRSQLRPSPRALRKAISQSMHSTYIGFFHTPLAELAWRTGIMRWFMARMEPTAPAPKLADGLHGLKLYRANIFGRLGKPGKRTTDVPVQVLAPSGDKFVGTPLQTEIGRWVSDLRVRRIAGSHWVTRTKPAVIARAAAELIEHVEGGPETRALRKARAADDRFAHRLAVVTGAGSGIGRASALALAERGADVVLTDINPDAVQETAKLLLDKGFNGYPYTVDSSDGAAVERFAEQVRSEHGVPDIVLNNAGIGMAGRFADTSVADWQRVIDVNLWGVIHGCRAFAPMLAERAEGGHIVNTASMAAYLPSKELPAYSTTKAAVLMLSQCLGAELAADRISVSAICPGFVRTGITGSTTFVGSDAAEQSRKQAATTKLYKLRNFGPEKVAADILRAIERDTAIKPSTPEAKATLLLSRLTPGLLRAVAKLDVTP